VSKVNCIGKQTRRRGDETMSPIINTLIQKFILQMNKNVLLIDFEKISR